MDKTPTVLIVEYEGSVQKLLHLFLIVSAYSVLPATSGCEAIDVVRANPASVDLVITPVSMPRMNGFELADQILRFSPKVRFLFTTSSLPVLPSDYLPKPFTFAEVRRRVRNVLDVPVY